MKLHYLLMLVAALSSQANATCPLFDGIKYNGQTLTVYQNTTFPESREYGKWWRSLPQCSAMNQGRPVYEVANNLTLQLVGFGSCSQNSPKLSDLYVGVGEALPATWLHGDIQAFGGNFKGISGFCAVYDTKYIFTVREGTITSVRTEQNSEVPEIVIGK
jgi:hypothetical protein